MMVRVTGVGVIGLMMVIAGLLPTPAFAQVHYQCSGRTAILVNYGGQHAELTFRGITYFLPQTPLAEGSRYSDGRFTWTVTRDQVGTLTQDGAIVASGCRTSVFSPPFGPVPGAGNTYTCAGGVTVTAAYSGSTALVTFLGSTHRLSQVPLAAGSRYTDGRFTWTVTRDQEGTLTHDGAVIAQGCRTAAFLPPVGPVTGSTTYACAGGVPVTVAYSGSTALVTFLGNTHRLTQVPLAAGSRYTDGRFTWTVTRDQEGTLVHDGAVIAQGCRTAAISQPVGPVGPVTGIGTTYICPGGGTVVVSYSGPIATVTFQGNTYRLVQVPLAGGSRYTDGRVTWSVTGDQIGTLEFDRNVIFRDCRPGGASQLGTITYTCVSGAPVTATYSGATAIVTFQGNTYRLVQVPLAEGTRYTDGRFTWTVSRGEEGTLTYLGSVVAAGCRNVAFQPREPER